MDRYYLLDSKMVKGCLAHSVSYFRRSTSEWLERMTGAFKFALILFGGGSSAEKRSDHGDCWIVSRKVSPDSLSR